MMITVATELATTDDTAVTIDVHRVGTITVACVLPLHGQSLRLRAQRRVTLAPGAFNTNAQRPRGAPVLSCCNAFPIAYKVVLK